METRELIERLRGWPFYWSGTGEILEPLTRRYTFDEAELDAIIAALERLGKLEEQPYD